MNRVERTLRSLDRFQQRHTPTAVVFGVVKKYGDDRGGLLAALICYYGFLALIPLLLLLSTALGFVLHGRPGAQRAVLDSALADFPIIGDQLRQNVHSLQGNGLAVAIGALGLLYGALGIAQVLQHAMAEIWNVPGVRRPGYWPRLVRSLLLLAVLGTGLLLATATASLVATSLTGLPARIGGLLVSAMLNTALCLGCFRVLTPGGIPTRALWPGCLLAGPLFTLLQAFGSVLVTHELRHAGQVYGFFATVIGLLFWLYLAAQITVYAAEANVVLARHLWPRSLRQPPLTDADEQVLESVARQEERRPEEQVEVAFTDGDTAPPDQAEQAEQAEQADGGKTDRRSGPEP
ncbi:YihY/virulence factor BrkB family protein [Streptomyces kaniharaensis]|uniref:YihY/virulence factor BrkB family protein n=1 Tax=Streptomyces kaniharaensis TaxID=212423 RepID=A0A6N7KYP9_9ACTN|nr:YihY/virulence factor BrkB family protein [Streptomyces kaniharaensis]MQS16816.1 YihY/virulence factor BrkB family protein [Streptomyces kaniharaensis]